MQALNPEPQPSSVDLGVVGVHHPRVIALNRGHRHSMPAIKTSDLPWAAKFNAASRSPYKNNENNIDEDEEVNIDVDGDNSNDQQQTQQQIAELRNQAAGSTDDDDEGGLVMVTGEEASSSSPITHESGSDGKTVQNDLDHQNQAVGGDAKEDESDELNDEEDRRLLAARQQQLMGAGRLQSQQSSRHHRKQQPPQQLRHQTESPLPLHRSSLLLAAAAAAAAGGRGADMYSFDGGSAKSVAMSPNSQRRHSMQIHDLSAAAAAAANIFPPRPGDLLLPKQRSALMDHDDQQGFVGYDLNRTTNRLLSSGSAAVNAAKAAAAAAAALNFNRNSAPTQPQQPQQPQQSPAATPNNGNNNSNGNNGSSGNTSALVPMWKDREVIALLDLYSSEKYQAKFRDPRNRKIFVWSEISNEINSQFFTGRTGMHCDQKFRNIKSAYKHRVLTNPNVSFVVRTNPIFQKMDAIYKMGLMDINDDGAGLSTATSVAKRNSRVEMPPPLVGQNQQQQLLLRHLQQQQHRRSANSDDERDDLVNEHDLMASYRRRASLDVSLLSDAVLQKRLRLQADNWSPPFAGLQETLERGSGDFNGSNKDASDQSPNEQDEDHNNAASGTTNGVKLETSAPVDLSSAFTVVGAGGITSRRSSRILDGLAKEGEDGADDADDSRFSTMSSPDQNTSPVNSNGGRKMSISNNGQSLTASHHALLHQLAAVSSAALPSTALPCSGCAHLGQIFLDFLIDMRDSAEVNHRQQSAKFNSLIRRMESIVTAPPPPLTSSTPQPNGTSVAANGNGIGNGTAAIGKRS